MVAMSGGVDSSVAAALLRDEGHEVVGVTMKLWGGDSDTGCCSVADVDDARRVAQQLDIAHHVFNFGEDFDAHVVDAYVAEHQRGRTPNPCIECNRHIKFDRLLERGDVLGFEAVATGHHARVVEHAGARFIARGADVAKDQSYVLYMLGQAQLARVVLPVGSFTKRDVRAMAEQLGLRTARKPESQDVCFITRQDGRGDFIGRRASLHPGRVIDETGAEVGSVDAVELVTVGQRKGLGLAGGSPPRYVTEVDVAGGTVRVGPPESLLTDHIEVSHLAWATGAPEVAGLGRVSVQCSAHGAPRGARLEQAGGGLRIMWSELQPAVAPGQSAVFYDGDRVVGGGLVEAPRARD